MNPLNFLKGYKTFIAGLGLISLGVYMITEGDYQAGFAKIVEGLAVLGIGAKIERVAANGGGK